MKHQVTGLNSMVVVCLGACLGGLFFALLPSFFPASYEASMTLEVTSPTSQGDYYNYDGFYALQAAEIATGNVEKWFVSPGFIELIVIEEESQVVEEISVRDLRKIISAEKISGSLVEVTFTAEASEIAEQRASAIESVITQRLQDREIDYKVELSQPVIRLKSHLRVLWFLAGVIFGTLIIGGVLVYQKFRA